MPLSLTLTLTLLLGAATVPGGVTVRPSGGPCSAPPAAVAQCCAAVERMHSLQCGLPSADYERYMLSAYWKGDHSTLSAASCRLLAAQKKNSTGSSLPKVLAEEILTHTHHHNTFSDSSGDTQNALNSGCFQSVLSIVSSLGAHPIDSRSGDPSPLGGWELLGPLQAGKLEMDGDPSFPFPSMWRTVIKEERRLLNLGAYMLGMSPDTGILSELATGGEVRWTALREGLSDSIEVKFPDTQWQGLYNGLSSRAVLEFQAWARNTMLVRESGMHHIGCDGPHTVYVVSRTSESNAPTVKVLVADVYRSGQMHAVAWLGAGVVGLLVPLRGAVTTQFRCTVRRHDPAGPAVVLKSVQHVPHIVYDPLITSASLDSIDSKKKGPYDGRLISPHFSILVQNAHFRTLSVSVSLLVAPAMADRVNVRVAGQSEETVVFSIAAGQTKFVPLELVPTNNESLVVYPSACSTSSDQAHQALTVKQFRVVLSYANSLTGETMTLRPGPYVDLECRDIRKQSFLTSFVDHDGSIAQAGVILPIGSGVNVEAPVLLSLHGTGITPLSQADAYKWIPGNRKNYIFGVKNYFVVAPSRQGAHNWEGVGQLTTQRSVQQVQAMMAQYARALYGASAESTVPLVSLEDIIIAGHSMGGHGAWVHAVSNPRAVACVSSTAGWVRKEDYANGNDFFNLDISKSYVDYEMKGILELTMSEHHVDALVGNLMQVRAVHVRVGALDATTHPWFSRRMHRLLKERGINSTYEEIRNKEHWFWDTLKSNDGGVLNDAVLRAFYRECYRRRSNGSRPTSVPTETTVSSTGSVEGNANPVTSDYCEISVVNVGTHGGNCGMTVLQQLKYMAVSTASVQCKDVAGEVTCVLRTNGNLRRLEINLTEIVRRVPYALESTEMVSLVVDGATIQYRMGDTIVTSPVVNVCWDGPGETPYICSTAVDPVKEKTRSTSGPVRMVYSRSLVLVYGTLDNRNTGNNIHGNPLYDLAVYLSNVIALAHGTSVSVLSDIEYITMGHAGNAIFIGGPMENGALVDRIRCPGNGCCAADGRLNFTTSSGTLSFSLCGRVFEAMDQILIATFPLVGGPSSPASGPGKDEPALGVVVHSNSPEGYAQMTRLAWPVVPPMVRPPFANYIPDFMVLDSSLWATGFGAARAAGYWNHRWGCDNRNAYVNHRHTD